ncbi:hypothetical protein HGRIS_010644 [Hohenbuehelia grisea]|uniref:chitin deacetylase n=1 Tax=Hohenbuehelia grisea TaxID=104357 RepID=A0ABR3IXJ0_9AGAR
MAISLAWAVACLILPAAFGGVEAHLETRDHECAPYTYPPIQSRLSSFPPSWQTATLRADDWTARRIWQNIMPRVPAHVPIKNPDAPYLNEDPDCWWTFQQCITPKLPGIPPDVASVPQPHTLGYGFDDGPNCSHNAFYDYLLAQKQKATMFFVGSNVIDWPLEAKRAYDDGHEICIHSWSHPYMTRLSNEQAFAELYYFSFIVQTWLVPHIHFQMAAVRLVTGITPNCWRPPFGDVDDRIRAIAHGLGLTTMLWKYDTNDWKTGAGADPSEVDANYERFIAEAAGGAFSTVGAILLMHELNAFTMNQAMKYYPRFVDVFEEILPVGEAIRRGRN